MKFLAAFVALLFVASCAPTLTPSPQGTNENNFTQQDTSGNDVSLSDFQGKVVIVEFWATWCGPCRAHTPRLKEMWDTLKLKNVAMIGVSLDFDLNAWRQYIADNELTWTHVSDGKHFDNAVARQFRIQSTPSFLIFDQNGNRVGDRYNFFEIAPAVEELLANPPI